MQDVNMASQHNLCFKFKPLLVQLVLKKIQLNQPLADAHAYMLIVMTITYLPPTHTIITCFPLQHNPLIHTLLLFILHHTVWLVCLPISPALHYSFSIYESPFSFWQIINGNVMLKLGLLGKFCFILFGK